jgi:hypothetical protein
MREIILSSIVALLVLNGCGWGSSSDSKSSSNSLVEDSNENISETIDVKKLGVGYYIDAAVEGVDYVCGSEIGITDVNGTFVFEEGADCNFTIGGLVLREINASSLEDNITIFEDNLDVAQLLQSLDLDGNASNGITIDSNASSTAIMDINLEEIPTDIALLDSIVEGLKAETEDYNGTVKTREEAQAHLDRTEKDLTQRGVKTQTRESGENQSENGNGSQDMTENQSDGGDGSQSRK